MKDLLSGLTPSNEEDNIFMKTLIDKHVLMLKNISKRIVTVVSVGLLMFALGPVFVILPHYFKTNEVKLEMPFIAYYPFNEFDARIYPFMYIHQLWTATFAVIMVYGPDYFFFTCCTFIHIQFTILSYDMERLEVDNVLMMGSFMAFLMFGLMEIFFYCYYGDIIMRSSMKVGDAIYNSSWYMTGAADRKLFLIVLTRSQKPCELSAYGFSKINLYAFTS
ncbi:hypothetical protein SFRURICE_019894, partial [Spodoptera frugiperda]